MDLLFEKSRRDEVYQTFEIDTQDDLCVIFTSGTTGESKGVVLHHGALANISDSFIHSYNVKCDDRILTLSSVSFASFLGEVIPTLCAGATLVLADIKTKLDSDKLFSLIESLGVTILSTVPSFIRQLNSKGFQPSCLRFLLSGGEALSESDIGNIKPPLKIVNGYGLTEATICSSYQIIDPSSQPQNQAFTLGKPISNTELYVLDEYGNISPIGIPGEIAIGE